MVKFNNNCSSFCSLCSGKIYFYGRFQNRSYFRCKNCESIMLGRNNYPSSAEEKKRYLEHNNDVNDIRYQNFVKPLISAITDDFQKHHKGLDYGAGPGPVITKMLIDCSYNIKAYDPYFYNYSYYLKEKYDYIVCCEVIEHFHKPYYEFKKLKKMLNEKGRLYFKTELFGEDVDFGKWYYKNDFTHVFFYTEKAIYWIKNEFDFRDVTINGRLIIFSN